MNIIPSLWLTRERTPKFRNMTWWSSSWINHRMSFDGHVLDVRTGVIFEVLYRLLLTLGEKKIWGGEISWVTWVFLPELLQMFLTFSHITLLVIILERFTTYFQMAPFYSIELLFHQNELSRLSEMIFSHYCFR